MSDPRNYHLTYTTQSGISDVVYHNEVILMTIDPFQWLAQKNQSSDLHYALLRYERVSNPLPIVYRAQVTYVTQKGIGNNVFTTELIYKHPITWINEKNAAAGGLVNYVLISWWKLA